MGVEVNEISVNAKGGTEMMCERLRNSLSEGELEKYQIIPSRVRTLDPDKLRVYWAHDLPNDGEAVKALGNNGYERFNRIVFVSHWQKEHFINFFRLPFEKCTVLQNAVEPISIIKDGIRNKFMNREKINVIYHTTPHRGLKILAPVFVDLVKEFPELHLHVYSSFGIYGWDARDSEHEEEIGICRDHPNITYYGARSNEEVREALKDMHVFAYPSIWPETSCMALMEAMSAGCVCVHPDFAALHETAANLTDMYGWVPDLNLHRQIFTRQLVESIMIIKRAPELVAEKNVFQQDYANAFYNWNVRKQQWRNFLKTFEDEPTTLANDVGPGAFVYRTS